MKDMSPKRHQLRGPSGEYVSASAKTRKMEEGILSGSKSKVREVESDEEDSNLGCYGKSDEKPVHVNIEKEVTDGNKPRPALLPNRSEGDEINTNDETRDEDGNINLRRSNLFFEPLEPLDSVP